MENPCTASCYTRLSLKKTVNHSYLAIKHIKRHIVIQQKFITSNLITKASARKAFIRHFIDLLRRQFDLTDMGTTLRCFLSIEAVRCPGQVHSWIIENARMTDCKPCQTPADSQQKLCADLGDPYEDPTLLTIGCSVAKMLLREKAWDRAVFDEELFLLLHPGYEGLYASKRSMDTYLFMNSEVLFKKVRKDKKMMEKVKPVVVHVNYHPDKLERMKAVVKLYVEGKKDALDSFPDGSRW